MLRLFNHSQTTAVPLLFILPTSSIAVLKLQPLTVTHCSFLIIEFTLPHSNISALKVTYRFVWLADDEAVERIRELGTVQALGQGVSQLVNGGIGGCKAKVACGELALSEWSNEALWHVRQTRVVPSHTLILSPDLSSTLSGPSFRDATHARCKNCRIHKIMMSRLAIHHQRGAQCQRVC